MRPEPGDPFPDADDIELMRLAREDRPEAFGCLVRRHQRAVLNFFHRMGAHTDADDLVQEAFVRLWRFRQRYRPTARFTTFLYTVARHVWLDSVRKRTRFRLFAEKWKADAEPSHDGGLGRMRARLDVQSALGRLPAKLRDVVVLSIYQGLRYDEVAEVLEIPLGTVKSRMFLALNRLKEIFDEEVDGHG